MPCRLRNGRVGDWSDCSPACVAGTRHRARAMISPAQFGGKECGESEEKEDCTSVCPASLLCGSVKDASDVSPIDGVTVQNDHDQRVETSGGEFCFSLAPGAVVTFSAAKDGYITTSTVPITITADSTTLPGIMMSKVLQPTEWRIVLSWKNKPEDLDSELRYGPEGSGCKLTYSDAGNGFRVR